MGWRERGRAPLGGLPAHRPDRCARPGRLLSNGRVCVVGSANLDLVAAAARHPSPGETVLGHAYAEHAGGKGLNQAVAAARAGATTSFVGAVGSDGAGDQLLGVLDDAGIERSGVRRADAPTGRAIIVVSDAAENTIVVVPGANATVGADRAVELPQCDVLLVQLEIPLDVVAATLTAARRRGVTTILNPAPSRPLDATVLGSCDVVVPNEHELADLGGVEALLGHGVGAVVVTRGAAGAEVCTSAGTHRLPAFAVTPVDTTGAGDAFCGTLAAGLAAARPLAEAATRACAAGALASTRRGAVPSMPTAAEVDALIAVAG